MGTIANKSFFDDPAGDRADRASIEAALRGDRRALEELIRRH